MEEVTLYPQELTVSLGMLVLKSQSPVTFARALRSCCWRITMEVRLNILASKFMKTYPRDYPKDAKHPPRSLSWDKGALCEGRPSFPMVASIHMGIRTIALPRMLMLVGSLLL